MSILVTIFLIGLGIWLFIKALPALLRFLLYSIIALPVWIVLLLFFPGVFDEGVLTIILLVLAISKSLGGDNDSSGYSYSSDNFVLNKRSKVIHDRWSDSVDTISERNRKNISFSEAQDLINNNQKYRFKK